MTQYKILTLLSLIFILISCTPPEKINEKWYQERWCALHNGKAEVRLKDNTRCDCILSDHAIEVDYARKWAEAIGQSLHYARMTGENAGILLIVEDNKDQKHLNRLKKVIGHHKLPIKVWITNQSDLK